MVARDRGQVLLLGGLAIAIVFLTAIPLSNSLVVSENAASSDAVADIDRTDRREAAVERSLVSLTRASVDRSPAALNRSLRNFTRYYTLVSGQQDGVYVNATLNVEATEGNVTNQTSSDLFQRQGGIGSQNDWNLAEDVDQIAAFEATFGNNAMGPGRDFVIIVDNGTESQEIRAEADPTSGDLAILNDTGDTVCSGSTVELDLVAGECDSDSSGSFTPINDWVEEPYTVRFVGGNAVEGTYTFASTGEFPDDSYDDNDYVPYGVRPAYDVQYIGSDVSYTQTIRVNATA